jgi:hypothetical protein
MKNIFRIDQLEEKLVLRIRALLTLILFLFSITLASPHGVQNSLSLQKTKLGLQKGYQNSCWIVFQIL